MSIRSMTARLALSLFPGLALILPIGLATPVLASTFDLTEKVSDLGGGLGWLDDNDSFGQSVDGLGDLDHDGTEDIIVGIPHGNRGGHFAGGVWVVFLNPDGTVKSFQPIDARRGGFGLGLETADYFGESVATLGDIDGDGVVDVAIGTPRDDDGGEDRGAFYIVFLKADGTVKSRTKIGDLSGGFTGILDNEDLFGSSLAPLGDWDGDGVEDLLVGAPGDDDGGVDRGAAWIIFLNSNGTVKSWSKISDTQGNLSTPLADGDRFGDSVTYLEDQNGDGLDDIAVGAPGALNGTTVESVYVLLLDTNAKVKTETRIADGLGGFTGPLVQDDFFGSSVRGVGDVDGDGNGDLAVGAWRHDPGTGFRGAFWILFLDLSGTVQSQRKIAEGLAGFGGTLDEFDGFGGSFAVIDDLSGNGVPDLLVGAFGDDDGGFNRGALWHLDIRQDGNVLSEQKISDTVDALGSRIGSRGWSYSQAGIGHLTSSSILYEDLAVGHPEANDGGGDRGAVYIVGFAASGRVSRTRKISDTEGGFEGVLDDTDRFGSDVDALGDLDGDGITDLIVGARWDDDGGENRGAAWILFMESDGTVRTERKISDTEGGFAGGLTDHDWFGESVAGIGDLDGDGVVDAAVGAPQDDTVLTGSGAVWILFLNPNGTVKAWHKIAHSTGGLPGLSQYDFFGESVCGLGDLDGDGVEDIAVGAPWDDGPGLDNRGAVWILFLDPSGWVLDEAKLGLGLAGDPPDLDGGVLFGSSVSAVPDVTGDGVIELAVGAPLTIVDSNQVGEAYLLYLNPNGTVQGYLTLGDVEESFPGGIDPHDQVGQSIASFTAGPYEPSLSIAAFGDDDGDGERGAVYAMRFDMTAASTPSDPLEATIRAPRSVTAFPNPANPRVTLAYDIAEPVDVSVDVYDARGARVRSLVAEALHGIGRHEVRWEGLDDYGRPVPSGVYMVRVLAGERVQSGRVTLLR